jgi:hypothetical protein
MKENPTPTPFDDDDDARDPLLAALQQRLRDYGAAPPPGAWAGIRQRLPVVPRPWWRRPRRVLPLLALLLGLVVSTATLRRWHGPGSLSPSVATSKTGASSPSGAATRTHPAISAVEKPAPVASSQTPFLPTLRELSPPDKMAKGQAKATTSPRLAAATKATNSLPDTKLSSTSPTTPYSISSAAEGARPARPATGSSPLAGVSLAKPLAQPAARKRPQALAPLAVGATRWPAPATAAASTRPRVASYSAVAATRQPTHRHLARPQRPQAYRLAGTSRRHPQAATQPQQGAISPADTTTTHALAKFSSLLASRRYYAAAATGHAARTPRLPGGVAAALPRLAAETLALRSAALLLPLAPPLPAPLAERPDSLPPALPVRRWALLAVAGPTLSYRTLGATTPAATTAPRPDFARLERPALGFGAQVQVRRVLSGRWALAVGLGYQEYATRLALQVTTDTTAASVRQRDTYRLLTLPVQLGYALGAPRGRLAKALLVGAEVGWYQGGRSTEGNDCGCQQTTYTATASPYRPRTLALSLGLDLRYRVGGAAGRWQWVVQPTGRYVLTPFTSAATAGFTARQPFSLGLLTGFSWDLR